MSHRQDRWCCWCKQRQQASGWGRWWAGAPEARPAGRACRSLTSERLPSPHVHGSQLPRCCDRGPLCLHLMARGSHRPLLTQGGRDVPSTLWAATSSAGSAPHHCSPLQSTVPTRRPRWSSQGARDMQQSCACSPVLPGQASPSPQSEQRRDSPPPLSCVVRSPRWDHLEGPVEPTDAPRPLTEPLDQKCCRTRAEGQKEHRMRPFPGPRRRAGPPGTTANRASRA